MRAAVLHLAFAGFGATRAETAAWIDNPRSIAVTRGQGYRDNGERVLDRAGEPTVELEFTIERATWDARRRSDIELVGVSPCLPMVGASR